ncbi:hypothetical protein TNCV_3025351 [Trichonephila clavipes]|nr:hypothetical protein TNCV_3025351 [Trichonephila clavipes]
MLLRNSHIIALTFHPQGLRKTQVFQREGMPPHTHTQLSTEEIISISSHHRLKGHLSKPQLVIIDRHRFNSITHYTSKTFGARLFLYSFPVTQGVGVPGQKMIPRNPLRPYRSHLS